MVLLCTPLAAPSPRGQQAQPRFIDYRAARPLRRHAPRRRAASAVTPAATPTAAGGARCRSPLAGTVDLIPRHLRMPPPAHLLRPPSLPPPPPAPAPAQPEAAKDSLCHAEQQRTRGCLLSCDCCPAVRVWCWKELRLLRAPCRQAAGTGRWKAVGRSARQWRSSRTAGAARAASRVQELKAGDPGACTHLVLVP